MTREELSGEYSKGTLRLHKLTDEFYEALHDTKDGSAIVVWEDLLDRIKEYRKGLSIELDYIKTVLDEHKELRRGQGLR